MDGCHRVPGPPGAPGLPGLPQGSPQGAPAHQARRLHPPLRAVLLPHLLCFG